MFGACGGHGCIVNDARGAVFQTVKTFNDDGTGTELAMDAQGRYKRNVVSDMQIIVAHAILGIRHSDAGGSDIGELPPAPERQTFPNSIHSTIVSWAMDGSALSPQYFCNGDSMHHGKLCSLLSLLFLLSVLDDCIYRSKVAAH